MHILYIYILYLQTKIFDHIMANTKNSNYNGNALFLCTDTKPSNISKSEILFGENKMIVLFEHPF